MKTNMERPLSPTEKGLIIALAQMVKSHLIKSGISKDKNGAFQ